MVTWEPWRKPAGGFHDAVQPSSRLARIVSGRDDAYIRSWARATARYGRPILLRPMQEMNGDWYPWAVTTNGNDAATFVAAWRRIHRIFDAAGARNVRWVWTVHAIPGVTPHFDAFYPGSAYVDWVSLTVFNWGAAVGWGKWETFDELVAPTYAALVRFDKPVMVSEIGTVAKGGDAPRWVRQTMSRVQTAYPDVKALVWFSYRYSRWADFRLATPSATALADALSSPYWLGGAGGSGGSSTSGSVSLSSSAGQSSDSK
jgi:beta-mannanase